jgi:DNA-binding MarR family transcriptional regulator
VLPDRRLRDTVKAAGAQEHFAVPRCDDRAAEVERALSVLANRDTRRRFYAELLQELGIELSPLEAWVLALIDHGTAGDLDTLGDRLHVDPVRVAAAVSELERREFIAGSDGTFAATDAGHGVVDRVVQARRERLAAALADWSPAEHEDLAAVLERLAHDLVAERPREVAA